MDTILTHNLHMKCRNEQNSLIQIHDMLVFEVSWVECSQKVGNKCHTLNVIQKKPSKYRY
jgi:hypothetical protein